MERGRKLQEEERTLDCVRDIDYNFGLLETCVSSVDVTLPPVSKSFPGLFSRTFALEMYPLASTTSFVGRNTQTLQQLAELLSRR